jgi:glycerol uptake facilitator-like aquaporin
MTFLLMTSVYGTAVDERGKAVKIGGFGIGLTVAFDILAGGAVTGASMNPARSFGPALEMMHWEWHLGVLGRTDCRGLCTRPCSTRTCC